MTACSMRAWHLLAALPLLFPTVSACTQLAPRTPEGPLGLAPCTATAGAGQALCGGLDVPEDPTRPGGRQIRLRIQVLPATEGARGEPVFLLAGGPGQAAADLAGLTAMRFGAVRRSRDIVLVDQRGTGGSNALACRTGAPTDPTRLFGPAYTGDEVRACRAELAARADLAAYTTENTVADLERVREALGAPQVTLIGGSYGTKVGLAYMRLHPARIRAAVLEGVAPPSFFNPLPHARGSQAALDSVFAACARDAACRAAAPDLDTRFAAVLARLAANPVSLPVSAGGRTGTATITRDAFAYGVHLLLFANQSAALVPSLITQAWRGEYGLLQSVMSQVMAALAGSITFGMQLSVTCREDLPGLLAADRAAAAAGSYLGGLLVDGIVEECVTWNVPPVDPRFYEPVRSSVPALLIAGALDPATPLSYAVDAASHLTRGRLIVVEQGAHITAHPCIDGLIAQFIATAEPAALATGCVAAIRRPPFQLVP